MKEKKLFIIRHAKAEEHSFSKSDFERNITERGINRILKLVSLIKENITINENIMFLSSSANRAIQTAELFAQSLHYPPAKISQTKSIYESHYKDILKVINKVPEEIDTLFIFGHNPGLSDLTNYLCNTYISLSTSAIAEIVLEENLNFKELSANTATLKGIHSE